MINRNMIPFFSVKFLIIYFVLSSTQFCLAKELNTDDKMFDAVNLTPVIVLDIEMLGDTSVEHLKKNDAYLMKKFSKLFRE